MCKNIDYLMAKNKKSQNNLTSQGNLNQTSSTTNNLSAYLEQIFIITKELDNKNKQIEQLELIITSQKNKIEELVEKNNNEEYNNTKSQIVVDNYTEDIIHKETTNLKKENNINKQIEILSQIIESESQDDQYISQDESINLTEQLNKIEIIKQKRRAFRKF